MGASYNLTTTYVAIIMLAIGTVGNIFSLVVLCRKKLRNMNIGLYMITLCLNDLLVLYTSLFNNHIMPLDINLVYIFENKCSFSRFFIHFFREISSWITVMITVHRMFAVFRPLSTRARMMTGYKPQIINIIIMLIILIGVNIVYSRYFYFENGRCVTPNQTVTVFFASIMYSFLPAAILISCNVIIIFTLCHRSIIGNASQSASQASNHTVYMVLAINILFLICTLPSSVALALSEGSKMGDSAKSFLILLCSFNNVFNFVLYMLAGRQFRDEMQTMLKRKRRPSTFTITTS